LFKSRESQAAEVDSRFFKIDEISNLSFLQSDVLTDEDTKLQPQRDPSKSYGARQLI